MLDHKTNRSRGFGFVTFESEDSVEKIFSDGRMHELGGKQVSLQSSLLLFLRHIEVTYLTLKSTG